MNRILAGLLLVCTIFNSDLNAWWPSGHKISAKIAYLNLTDEAREEVDRLLKSLESFYPEHTTFSQAATWADDLKIQENVRLYDTWHFTNIPYDPESILSAEDLKLIAAQNIGNDIVSLIPKAIEALSSEKATSFTKTVMLYWLIHTVADIHQPLHCCSRYSKEFPDGDRGGNLFLINGMAVKNLHQFWDGAVGLLSYEETDENIDRHTSLFMNLFPKENYSDLDSCNAQYWAAESQQIAVNSAFCMEINSVPSEEYISKNRSIAAERITLAGYRLAALLNRIFK